MDTFTTHLEWSGATFGPTRDQEHFSRNLEMTTDGTTIPMSSAPQFRGDADRVNPEQLFVAAVSACHALTYLFLAGRAGIRITGYTDDADGALAQADGKLRMTRVVLHPRITLERVEDESEARELIEKSHRGCFIANSVRSEVSIQPEFLVAERQANAA